MNKKLYKIALISSPIMAAFEITPLFFLVDTSPFRFWAGLLVLSILIFLIWILNIFVIKAIGSDKILIKQKQRYALSYLITIVFLVVLWFTSQFLPPNKDIKRDEKIPPIFFPLMNIMASNTIILIISNSIVVTTKKNQIDAELAELKIKHLEAEQQQLLQQLQPHFLFNSLSTLKSIINTDAELASEYLVKLSDFLRFTISAQENTIIPLSDELKFTKDYIDLQRIRFEGSFFCTISIPDECINQYGIPVYALQSLIENAIKHNAFTEEEPLYVYIAYQAPWLTVSNNKHPKPKDAEETGIGLKNLKKRYLLGVGEDVMVENGSEVFTVKLKLIKSGNVC
ncbi:MAG: histidine kinase [Breznakibacter sp.]